MAYPPRLDDVLERWWALPPRARQAAGALVAVIVLTVAGSAATRSPWGEAVPALVLVADGSWGDHLGPDAVAVATVPASTLPLDAVRDRDALALHATARLRGPLPAGTILRSSHLADAGVAGTLADGRAAVPVRQDQAQGRIDDGVPVDIVAAGNDGRGHVLARSARVLRAADDGVVWVDVARDEAAAVAGATATDAIRIVVLPG